MTILTMDARSALKILPDKSVDLIVTDPPYRVISGGNESANRPVGMLSENDGRIFEHNDIEPDEYAPDLFRVLTNPGHAWVMCNELNRRKMEDAMLRAGFVTHFLGAWVKNTVTPNRWGMKNGELLFLFRKGAARTLYNPSLKQFIHHANPVGNKLHPTEKPVALMRDLVEASSLPGQTVLDPFCGAGAVGVACRESGRQFLGFEIDPKYADVARGRC